MPNIGDPRLRKSFWNRVSAQDDGCWQWTGFISPYGYGSTPWPPGDHESQRAHRMAYIALVGPVPDGLVIDHLCRNRGCVNPDHLEAVTQQVNAIRGIGPAARNAKAVECIDGHALSGANLYVTKDGRRQCRECRAKASRNWRKKVAQLAR